MLNLNDDMDDLIRQAADDYPLKTGSGDWDRVVGGMQSAVQSTPANNKKYWWLLLLLLPLMIGIFLFNKNKNSQQEPSTITKSTANNSTLKSQDSNTLINKDNRTKERTDTGLVTDLQPSKETREASKGNLQDEDRLTTSTESTINNRANSVREKDNKQKEIIAAKNNAGKGVKPVTNATADDTNNNDHSALKNSNNTTVDNQMDTAVVKETQKNSTDKENAPAATTDTVKNNTAANTLQKDSAVNAKQGKSKKAVMLKRKGFYAGVGTALDATTVKFNKTTKLGYSASFIVGYRINNNWSVESGLEWDDKKYYSPGKYFDKSRTTIPEASYIHFLNGRCRMYEVPLNIRFDFNSRKMSSFFISAGLSSYFMKKEDYEYHATNSGNYYVAEKNYKNSTNNLFSIANISGGYQLNFKNNHSLRIEPYFKVPLRGLGIGKLPFESTGISAAYTLPLH